MDKKYKIEEVKNEHLPELMELVKVFHKETLSDYGVDTDVSKMEEMFFKCKKTTLVLLEEGKVKGVISGFLAQPAYSGEYVWQEIIWYVYKENRSGGVRLYKAMEKKLKAMGVLKMIMVLMHNSKKEKLEAFYKKLGYAPMETQYILDLEEK